ncbi:hypothetical protein [Myceligenerans cantabricum]
MPDLVRFCNSLSNRSGPLFRLLKAVDDVGGLERLQASEATVDALIGQTGADRSAVRLKIKENRKLSAAEITELVERYEAGTTIRSLGDTFGMHEQTVRAHLRRQGVTLRPVCSLTPEQDVEVERLYVAENWTMAELGRRFEVDASSIRRALVRRGVERRPQKKR